MALKVGELFATMELKKGGFDRTLSGVKSGLLKVGKVAAVGAAAGVAAVGAAFAKSEGAAENYQQDMANVGTLLDGNKQRTNELGKAVQRTAMETGKSLHDMAGGMYQTVSAFGDGADTAKILEINAKAAAAGLASTTDSVNLTSAVTKGYGDTSAKAVQHVADLAFQTVKLGQTTFPELARSMGQAVPLASSLGVNMNSLFGSMATLTGVTGDTNQVATQMRQVFQALVKPSADMQKQLKAIGFASGQAAIKQLGLQGTLNALKKSTHGNTTEMAKMFNGVEGLNAVLALTGKQADNFKKKTQAMANSQGEMNKAFKTEQATAQEAKKRMVQAIDVQMVKIGKEFLPLMSRFYTWFAKQMPAIGAFFTKMIGVIQTGVSFFSNKIMPMFSKSAGKNGPVVIKAFMQIWEIVKPVMVKLEELIMVFVTLTTAIWAKYGDQITAIIRVMWDLFVSISKNAAKIIEGIIDVFIGILTGNWSKMGQGLKEIWSGLWGDIVAIIRDAPKIIMPALGIIWDNFKNWFNKLAKQAETWGGDVIAGIWQGIKNAGGKFATNLGQWVNDHIPGVVKKLLKISSPSQVMFNLGGFVSVGLAKGIEAKAPAVDKAARRLTQSVGKEAAKIKKLIDGISKSIGAGTVTGGTGGGQFMGMKGFQSMSQLKKQYSAASQKTIQGMFESQFQGLNVPGMASSSTSQVLHQINIGNVSIPAKDLKEVKSVQDFFNRLQQEKRRK